MPAAPPANTAKAAGSVRVLVVGTAGTVGYVARLLGGGEGGLEVAARVEVGPEPAERPLAGVARQGLDLALICLPLEMAARIEGLGRELERLGLPWRFLPTLEDQLAGRIAPTAAAAPAPAGGRIGLGTPLWSIDPEQLLDRKPHPLDEGSIRSVVCGQVVLITGAGGSIGSELARIVCRFDPARLVLVERSENALFEVDRDIARRFPAQSRSAVLHDVTDAARTLGVLRAQKPDLILHAAAHKHVPMMEGHPAAAVENNFYGTRSLADAACRAAAGRFVMISTDKAVRPSSVMGSTKRLAELYIQHLSGRSDTVFSMVRFGNVLGSACSVLPIWAEQLARGGPITVTHPAMTRYFMTIPEAAGLVLQSAAFAGVAGGGEVFLLDMGQPVRILDLAQRFIRSQGLDPQRDVPVQITGIRPGEKLFEELAYDSEEMIPTPHPSVRIWKTARPQAALMQQVIARLDELRGRADQAGRHLWQGVGKDDIMSVLRLAVPEMTTPASDAPEGAAPTGPIAMPGAHVTETAA